MDTVFVRGLSVRGKHGVHERERQEEQEFLFDIAADFDTTGASRTDDLADTVNYSRFVEITERIVSGNSFFLIEKLGGTIAEEILEDRRISSVRVTVQKPSVLKNGIPGVTIIRTRV